MSEYQEFTGKSVEEALRAAREAFGVSGLNELDFEILTPGSRGVLGMGAEPARIIAAPRSALGARPSRTDAPREAAPREVAPRSPAPREAAPREAAPREPAAPAPAPIQRVAGPAPRPAATPGGSHRPAAPERHASRPPATHGRAGRTREGGPTGPSRGQESRRASGLSEREADEVATARATVSSDREEIQAAEASPEALEAGREILEKVVELMGYRAAVSVSVGTTSKINIDAQDESEREALGALIGRKGERLSALQHLVNLMLSKKVGAWTRVLVDVEDYRGRRERQVTEVARRAAEKVLETGTMLQLEPMTALERRWVHIALREVEGVATQSIGEEPSRRIVVLRV